MKTIDEIAKHINDNGYAGLTDEEIEKWISWKEDCAKRDEELEARLEAIRTDANNKAAAYQKMADESIKIFHELCDVPLDLKRVGDDD